MHAEALHEREVKWTRGEIAPVGIRGGRARDHASVADGTLDEERIAGVEPREHDGSEGIAAGAGRTHLEPHLDRGLAHRAVARVVEKFERGIFKALRCDASALHAVLQFAGDAREWHGRERGKRSVPPRDIRAVAGENEQAAAIFHVVLQHAQLLGCELAHIGKHDSRGVGEVLCAERIRAHDVRLDEVAHRHLARGERRECDLQVGGLGRDVVGRRPRCAVHEQHGDAVAHGDACEVRVVRGEHVRLGGNLDDVRARRVEHMREEHLRLCVRPEVRLRRGLVLAVHFQSHAQVGVVGVAEIAEVRAELHLLSDADHEL